jgi:hypothetical protein
MHERPFVKVRLGYTAEIQAKVQEVRTKTIYGVPHGTRARIHHTFCARAKQIVFAICYLRLLLMYAYKSICGQAHELEREKKRDVHW